MPNLQKSKIKSCCYAPQLLGWVTCRIRRRLIHDRLELVVFPSPVSSSGIMGFWGFWLTFQPQPDSCDILFLPSTMMNLQLGVLLERIRFFLCQSLWEAMLSSSQWKNSFSLLSIQHPNPNPSQCCVVSAQCFPPEELQNAPPENFSILLEGLCGFGAVTAGAPRADFLTRRTGEFSWRSFRRSWNFPSTSSRWDVFKETQEGNHRESCSLKQSDWV